MLNVDWLDVGKRRVDLFGGTPTDEIEVVDDHPGKRALTSLAGLRSPLSGPCGMRNRRNAPDQPLMKRLDEEDSVRKPHRNNP